MVRVTAGEIRKRLAQFYQEEEHTGEIRIDLPLGSYVPEFRSAVLRTSEMPPLKEAKVVEGPAASVVRANNPQEGAGAAASDPPVARALGSGWKWKAGLAAAALVVIIVAVWFLRTPADQQSEMWGPLLASKIPALVLVGQPSVPPLDSSTTDSVFYQQHGAASEMFFHDGVALGHICGVLGAHPYQISTARLASVEDLMKKPVILVGAFDNSWTLRLLRPLRFSLVSVGSGDSTVSPQVLQIADREKQSGSPWTVDFREPIGKMTHDYAVIARFQDATTEGTVMVVAGIGSTGTESAGEFVSSAAYMKQLAGWAPRNWSGMNMEAVIETEIIEGRAGHPRIIAAEFW